ncbi:MAG: PLP-dependent aminotransferase family protein [Selenomonadaceae bacterium]|nr:PLP-dependent aminotransferase family protein [Selenomonadaceae bacterium]
MIKLDKNKRVPLYEQLYRELRKNIISGTYEKDYRLKPIRVFAKELSVSINTVNRAYQQLLEEGYITSSQGSGFYVEEMFTIKGDKKTLYKQNGTAEESRKAADVRFDFSRKKLGAESFPWGKWLRYVQNAIVDLAYKDSIKDGTSKGSRKLRQAIADYIRGTRGVKCTADQVIVCPTTEHAMEIITHVLPADKRKLGMEEPGSVKMRQLFSSRGMEIQPVPVTNHGIDVNALEHMDCDCLYVTPSFQFPTGVQLPLVKRLQLIEWCRRRGAYCIENDYENEFLLGSEPVMSLQSLDSNERVIFVSTFSTVLSQEIKSAFLVLPLPLVKVYEEKYKYYRSAISDYEQKALTAFIKDGQLERQSRKAAVLNRRKKEFFFRYAEENMTDIAACLPCESGSHYLLGLYDCVDADGVVRRLADRGIIIASVTECWQDRESAPRNLVMLSFNSIRENELEKACRYMETELRSVLRRKG